MRDLADFEGYIEQFAPTAEDLIRFGTGDNRCFDALIAVDSAGDRLAGIAVLYTIPWTYDLKPTVVLKELFVRAAYRCSGVGQQLMAAVAEHAVALGAERLHWTVLADNDAAQSFYQRLGGQPDRHWQHWEMTLPAMRRLAGDERKR